MLTYLQYARNQQAGKFRVRTHAWIVLPGAYGDILNNDRLVTAQARGMAALRELRRTVEAPETVTIEWDQRRAWTLIEPAAEIVYAIDGSRDTDRAQQLEGAKDAFNVFPVAIADAIYAHALPTMGAVLESDAMTLIEENIQSANRRWSTFGIYTVCYAWDPLIRSSRCGLRPN